MPLFEFRPGVFAKWMDEATVHDNLWRFDGKRWRPRNLADTGFCSGPQAAPMGDGDRNLGTMRTPSEILSTIELGRC
ncbi:MAG: hypothetical protein JRD89_07030 [Deltaproteobacteria bacterium]|nr:hypothetical protein [Deltaproteobacteria bacterium]